MYNLLFGLTPKMADKVQFPTPPVSSSMPLWYDKFLTEIKNLVVESRRKIIWTANQQMMMMYYHIGKTILAQQEAEGWGTRVIDRLSADLKNDFPELRGFSTRNLKYMRKFADMCPQGNCAKALCTITLGAQHYTDGESERA